METELNLSSLHPENLEYLRQMLDEFCDQTNMQRKINQIIGKPDARQGQAAN